MVRHEQISKKLIVENILMEVEEWQKIMMSLFIPKEPDTISEFIFSACKMINKDVSEIMIPGKERDKVLLRQIIQAAASLYSDKHKKGWSLDYIAKNTAVKNHATIKHSKISVYNMHYTKYTQNDVNYYNIIEVVFGNFGLFVDNLIKKKFFHEKDLI
jgi:hypothetical protein